MPVRASADATGSLPGFNPIRPRRTFEEIIVQIEREVLEGRLAIGDRLPPERELAERLQVSRSSVREALRVLEAFGVLRARRGAGADSGSILAVQGTIGLAAVLRLYTSLQRIPLRDLVEIRHEIEKLAARSAAELAGREQVEQLDALVAQMQGATELEDFLQCDTEFHVAIARMSGNSLAPLLMEALREAMAREMLKAFRALTDWPGERKTLIAEHAEVAAKVAAGDGAGAALAVSRHITGFYGRVLETAENRDGEPRPRRRRFGRDGMFPVGSD